MELEREGPVGLDNLKPGERRSGWLALSPSLDGPFRLPVVVLKGARPGPKVVVISGQHGDEAYGVLGLLKALEAINPAELAGEVWAAPCANIAAYVDGRHHSPFDHQDMNRVHPGNSNGTMTEQISAALFAHLLPGADLMLDLHGGSTELGNIPYCRWTDVEGKPSIREVAESLGIEYLASPTDRKIPGMLSLALLQAGVPGISIEACSCLGHPRENAAEMAEYTLRLLRQIEMLPGGKRPRGEVRYTRMWGVRARVSGAYETFVTLGEEVRQGQALGCIRDFLGNIVQRAEAAESGVVGVLRTGIRVHPGESLVWLLIDAERP